MNWFSTESNWLLGMLGASALSFLALAAVFYPLEKAFPAKAGQRIFRPEWALDLCFMLGQYLLWSVASLWLLTLMQQWLHAGIPAGFRAAVAGQPWWLQAIQVVLLGDLAVYWGHRLQHTVPFLWRFHSTHHTAEHLDWLAAHREHPIDGIYTQTMINLPAFVLGFPLQTLVALIAFRGLWAIYIHSNVRLPLGWLGYIIGSPQLHHWHHSKDVTHCNYGNVCPLMDLIFGTHYLPPHEPPALGVKEPSPKSYLAHMLHPFRRRPTK